MATAAQPAAARSPTSPDADSCCTWRASGSRRHRSAPASLQTIHWAGSGRTALTALPGAGATGACSLVGEWNPAAEAPRFELSVVGARHEAMTATAVIQEGGKRWTTPHLQSLELPDRLAEQTGRFGLRWVPDVEQALPEADTRFEHTTVPPGRRTGRKATRRSPDRRRRSPPSSG